MDHHSSDHFCFFLNDSVAIKIASPLTIQLQYLDAKIAVCAARDGR
jgi:hypothetical protein